MFSLRHIKCTIIISERSNVVVDQGLLLNKLCLSKQLQKLLFLNLILEFSTFLIYNVFAKLHVMIPHVFQDQRNHHRDYVSMFHCKV